MSSPSETEAGTLVLVVGPSGAGKDTLIAIAQNLLREEAMVVFPRRIVTREGSAAEDHDSITPDDFDEAVRQGTFAFWWEAHGLKYALPSAIDDDIRRGKTVVCNVSRMIVPHLRRRYVRCKVVLVDAPREIRAARISARGRATDAAGRMRLDRIAGNEETLSPDVAIQNVGDPRDGGRALANMLLYVAASSTGELSTRTTYGETANA